MYTVSRLAVKLAYTFIWNTDELVCNGDLLVANVVSVSGFLRACNPVSSPRRGDYEEHLF